MTYWNKVFRDFDRCHNYETDTDKLCKNCDEHQRQLCEAEANLTDNKPLSKQEGKDNDHRAQD